MDKEYKIRIDKIEVELEKWLPGYSLSGNAELSDNSTAWKENVFHRNMKNIDDESLRSLISPASDILSRGGKRWRPLLMTLICENLGGGGKAIPFAPLVEFSHNASLIHDDIEDDSDERRSKPAIHKIYGIDTAINSGSFLYFLGLSCIESFAGNRELFYKLWAKYISALHLGQAMDINWHRKILFIPSVDDYFVMCRLKTGSLSRLAAEIGSYAAGASDEISQKFGEAAEKLGVGFQILDDIKSLTTGVKGKTRGDDIAEGKKSLPIILFLSKFPDNREFVYYCFHSAKTDGISIPEVDELIRKLHDTHIIDEAEKTGYNLINEAQKMISGLIKKSESYNEKSFFLLDNFIKLIS